MAKHEQSTRREQPGQPLFIQKLLGKGGRAPAQILFAIRRISYNQSESRLAPGQLSNYSEHILDQHLHAFGWKTRRPDILA